MTLERFFYIVLRAYITLKQLFSIALNEAIITWKQILSITSEILPESKYKRGANITWEQISSRP